MDERDLWSLAWAGYTATVISTFAVMEAAALRRPNPSPTYTRSLARWFGCHPAARHRPIALAALACAQAWLTVHVARWQPPEQQV